MPDSGAPSPSTVRVSGHCRVNARFFAPPAELAGCLTSIYRLDLAVDAGTRAVDWLQPEWANLRAFKGDLPTTRVGEGPTMSGVRFTITGPSSRAAHFELGSTRMWGIGFLPLGWARFVGKPAAGFANLLADAESHPDFARFSALPDVFGEKPDDEAEFARIVAILRSSARDAPAAEAIGAVHRAMVELDLATVGDFAALAGISIRALERTCRRHFGFAPKLLLRRQRFMRSLAAWMLGGMGRWSPAIDTLYTDQAHFNHEFHEFMGMSPSDYAGLPHPILSAFMEQRAKVWGSPAQTLDRPGTA